MEIPDIIQLALLIVTSLGLTYSVISNAHQTKMINRQLRLSFYTDYTKRYQEIILNFPENINDMKFSFDTLEPEVRNKTLRYMRAYFDLCSEEYDLFQKGLLEKDTWQNWEDGIKFAFTKTAFIQSWEKIKDDTIYYKSFTEWVNKHIQ